jgi:MFS family permease
MININRIIKILIGADLLFMIAYGFLNPVFAIFLVQSIQGGTAKVAGIAIAILWLTKSVFRLPIAYFLDKNRGEHDDFYSMIIGFLIFSLSHFLYLFAKLPIHVYGIQFLMGLGAAFAFTPWYGFFARHIDRYHENFEWSIEVSLVGFGIAAASFATGIIADKFGFAPIFVISGIFALMGTLLNITSYFYSRPH